MTKPLKLSTLTFACAMSGALVLGGCGKKNKAPKAAQLEEVQKRTVDEAEATKALKAMALDSSGDGVLSWAARDGKAGNYVYRDVTIKDDTDELVKVGEMELVGVHMEGESPAFDKIVFKDVNATDIEKGDKTEMHFGKIAIVKPSPALAKAFAEAFNGDDDAFENIEGEVGFKAMSLADMSISDKDVNMNIKALNMGEADDKTGVFSLKDLSVDGNKDEKVKIRLESIDVTGANLKKYKGIIKAAMKDGDSDKFAAEYFKSTMNVYDPDFRHASLKGLDADIEGLKITLDSYVADATKKGDKMVMEAKMTPLRVVPPAETTDRGMKEFKKALDTMGYDSLEFTAGGTSILDEKADSMVAKDTFVAMKDGFRFSYDLDMTGYKAFMEQAAAMQAEQAKNGGKANPMAAMGMMSALTINKMHVAFRDDSIVDRVFKLAAAEKGGSPEALKSQAKAMLGFLSMAAKDEAQQKLAQDIGKAVSELIDNGGSLVIDVNPQQPVNLMQLGMGAASGKVDVNALGITVSHEPAE